MQPLRKNSIDYCEPGASIRTECEDPSTGLAEGCDSFHSGFVARHMLEQRLDNDHIGFFAITIADSPFSVTSRVEKSGDVPPPTSATMRPFPTSDFTRATKLSRCERMTRTTDSVEEAAGCSSKRTRPLFTVFTPTRNRANLIHRMYESLLAQTLRDFEWVVVDNASTDGTADLLSQWRQEAPFPIRYFRRESDAGVLASFNLAIREASGELFLPIRDADTIVPTALERFNSHWNAIPPGRRERYAGVTVNCVDEQGRLFGTPIPDPYVDSDAIEICHRYRVNGEKWGFQRTDVMRAHMVPEVPSYSGHMPEGIIWRRIAQGHRTRYVNETLRVWRRDQAVRVSSSRRFWADAYGALIDASDALRMEIRWFVRSPLSIQLYAIRYARSCFHLGRSLVRQWQDLPGSGARALWISGLPAGWLMYLRDDRYPRRTGEDRAIDPQPRGRIQAPGVTRS